MPRASRGWGRAPRSLRINDRACRQTQDRRSTSQWAIVTFTSLPFLIFLPLVFLIYWRVPDRRWQNGVVVASSFVFYSWFDWRFALLMAASCAMDYTLGRWIEPARGRRRRLLLIASCVLNLLFLAVFKYLGFFVTNALLLLHQLGLASTASQEVVRFGLPIGISFYTLKSLSYTIDVYRERLPACRDLIEFVAFVSFFPQLVAGPIDPAIRLLPQFQSARGFELEPAVDGCRQILWGVAKKLLVADVLAPIVDRVYANPAGHAGPDVAFAAICFIVQIYCDFSAYSDIACGTARLFGISLMRNFAFPFFSLSFTELWRRWHISLMRWFLDYVYVPLGGNRFGTLRTTFNIGLVFVLAGLWHGAAWHFVLFGLFCGLGCVISRGGGDATSVPGGENNVPGAATIGRMAFVFLLFAISGVLFRADNVADAVAAYGQIATAGSIEGWRSSSVLTSAPRYVAAMAVFFAVEWTFRREEHPLRGVERWLRQRHVRWLVYTVAIWTILTLAQTQERSFIYSRF